MYATPTQKTLSLLTLLLLFAVPASADHFTSREDQSTGQERGIVVSHGMDLFILTRNAGGVSPARRAEIVAERLQQLTETPNALPENFRIGHRNGEVVLVQQEADHPTRTIVMVDPQLTASGHVTRLARWWLALLRDHLALAMGHRPKYTEGTRVGAVFQKLYSELGEPAQPVPSDAIDHALQTLSPDDRSLFTEASMHVPAAFASAPGSREATMDEEAGDNTAKPDNATGDTPPKDERNNPETATDGAKPPTDSPRPRVDDPGQPQDNAGATDQNGDRGRNRDAQKTNGENAQIHDPYKVVLVTDPGSLVPGKRADIAIRLLTSSPDDSPVTGASVRGWLARASEKPTKSIPGNYDADADLYRFSATLPRNGDVEFHVGVLTESGDVFKVVFPLALADAQDDTSSPPRRSANGSRTRHIGAFAVTMNTDPRHLAANQDSQVEIKIRDEDTQAWVTKATVRIWLLAEGQEATDVKPITAESAEEPGIYFCQAPGVDIGKYRLLVKIETSTGRVLRVTFPITVGQPDQNDNGNSGNSPAGDAKPENSGEPPVPETALPV